MAFQCCSAVFLLFTLCTSALGHVQVYEPASIYKRSGGFRMKAGGQKVTVLAMDDYDYAHFSAESGIEIEVTVLGKVPINDMSIVASRFDYNNMPRLQKNTVTWRIDDPKHFIFKIEGLRELVVAVDPLEKDVPLPSGPNIFNVVTPPYKADKLGKRVTTHAFEAAISDAAISVRPNPVVYVPAGVYLVGNLVLPSKTSLYLAPGAVIRFTGKPSDYRRDWEKDTEGRAGTYWISTAHNSTDIKIYGRGTIDANAHTYKDAKFAPNIVVAVLTDHFTLDGPVLRQSGSTAMNVVRSSSVDISNLKVFNSIDNLNDNGSVDVVESQNVTVHDTVAVSLADTFTSKASKPPGDNVPSWPGALRNSSDITFKNCLGWTGNYGFKVGQGAVTDQSNITFLNSTVYNAAVGMGIHKKWGNGTATNVTFENMIIKSNSFTTSYLQGMVGSWLALFVEDGKFGVGPISNVHIKSVWVGGVGGSTPLIGGVPGAGVSNVDFQNIHLPGAAQPAESLAALGLQNLSFASNITVVSSSAASSRVTTPLSPPSANLQQHSFRVASESQSIVDEAWNYVRLTIRTILWGDHDH